MKRIYFNNEKQVKEYLRQKNKDFARLFMETSNARAKIQWFEKAIELGYSPKYVVEQGNKEFEIVFGIELPKKVTPEDKIRIEHSHQNLDSLALDSLILTKLKSKK